MQGSFEVKEVKTLNKKSEHMFNLNTVKLPGELVREFHVITNAGEIGKHIIHREGFLLIQERHVDGGSSFYIHPYEAVERKSFYSLGEAVGFLINETLGETEHA